MRFGARRLFEDVTCSFLPGRRYAISGPNGAGKSTFMKILTREIEPSKGSITRPKKVGVLRQDQFAFDKFRVIDTVIMGNASLWKSLEERDMLYAKAPDELTDKVFRPFFTTKTPWSSSFLAFSEAGSDLATGAPGFLVSGSRSPRWRTVKA